MDIFAPDKYYHSIYTINYKALKKSGIKCLLFDLDNTLCPFTAVKPSVKEKELVEGLKDMGFKVIIISNSPQKRLEPFKEGFNVDTACSSRKPLKKKYKKILDLYKFKDTQIAAIGDQLMTDILGANRMGLTSILVDPLTSKEYKWTKINRFFEKIVLRRFAKKGILVKGEYYD